MAHGPESWILKAAYDTSLVTCCAGTAMRRASNRIPKRSLEPHFEMSHSVPNPKGRAARRGPIGSSKAHKPSDMGTGVILTLDTEGPCCDGASPHGVDIAAMCTEALAQTECLISTSGKFVTEDIYACPVATILQRPVCAATSSVRSSLYEDIDFLI